MIIKLSPNTNIIISLLFVILKYDDTNRFLKIKVPITMYTIFYNRKYFAIYNSFIWIRFTCIYYSV